MNAKKKVIFSAGGTGGHVYPALAIAKNLISENYDVLWIGTTRGIEKKIIEAESINIKYINFQGIRNKGFITILKSPFLLLRACYQVYKIYKFYKPDLTICFGGYVTVPCGLIAFLKKIPLFIHEQNSVLGLSNKILSLFSQKILMGYRKPGNKYLYSGNPMRESINRISKKEKNFKNNLNILVLGGSLGAKVFNERIPFAAKQLIEKYKIKNLEIVHQAGKTHGIAQDNYKKLNINCNVKEYIDNIQEYYEWCDIVICRSGAISLAELMTVGIPSISIPYKYATDNHQYHNAKLLSDAGALVLMDENLFDGYSLAEKIYKIISVKNLYKKIHNNTRNFSHFHSKEKILGEIKKHFKNNI